MIQRKGAAAPVLRWVTGESTFKILRILVGLALMLCGSYVLVKGGMSYRPFHVYWGCLGLGLVMLLPGALLFRPSLFLSSFSGRQ